MDNNTNPTYIHDEVCIKNEGNKIIIFNLEDGSIETYNSDYYHVWWATFMFKNYGSMPLYNSKNDIIKYYSNVNGNNGGQSERINSIEEARAIYANKIKQ